MVSTELNSYQGCVHRPFTISKNVPSKIIENRNIKLGRDHLCHNVTIVLFLSSGNTRVLRGHKWWRNLAEINLVINLLFLSCRDTRALCVSKWLRAMVSSISAVRESGVHEVTRIYHFVGSLSVFILSFPFLLIKILSPHSDQGLQRIK